MTEDEYMKRMRVQGEWQMVPPSKSKSQELPPSPRIIIPALEKLENAKWLALLIDTEGSLGWTHTIWKGGRINKEYRYIYPYYEPAISVGMKERESKATIDEAGRLLSSKAYSIKRKYAIERVVRVDGRKALVTTQYCMPYFVKFKRLAKLCLTLFKYRVYMPEATFRSTITELFGEYITADEAFEVLADMTEEDFETFLKEAEKVTSIKQYEKDPQGQYPHTIIQNIHVVRKVKEMNQ